MVDIVEEDTFLVPQEPILGTIQVVANENSAPVALLGNRDVRVRVQADVLVQIRGHDHLVIGSSQQLDRSGADIDFTRKGRATDTDPRISEFEYGTFIHH